MFKGVIMEYRDLYDENKVLTGETIKKGDPIPAGRYYITVAVWIQNSKDEFLLQVNKKFNKWSTTGGHPKTGESSLEGMVIEIKEELGVDVNKEDLVLFETIKTEDDFVDIYYLKKDIDLENIEKQEEEVDSVKWFAINDIKELIKNEDLLLPHIEFFNKCLEYLNNN